MSIHRLRAEGMALVARDLRRMVYRRIPLMVLALGMGLAVPPLAGMPMSLMGLAALGVLGLSVTGLGLWAGLRKAEAQFAQHFETYSLELSDEALAHRSAIVPEKRLARAEVAHLEESSQMGLVVRGRTAADIIVISPHLEGYDEVRAQLAAWRELVTVSDGAVRRRQQLAAGAGMGLSLLLIGLWVGVGWLPDIRLAMACGAVMCGVGLLALRVLRRWAPGLNRKPLVAALIFFALSIPARLVLQYWTP
jgi:hypothetical protein